MRRSVVYRVLTKGRLLMGVDYRVAVILWAPTIWALMVLQGNWVQMGILFGVVVVVHFVLKFVTKRDFRFFDLLKRYQRQADWYDPWPRYRSRRNFRPVGFGRDMWKG